MSDRQTPADELPEDLAARREAYREMFGTVPPLPEAKFGFTAGIDADFLRAVETLRAHAFHTTALDPVTVQLIIVGIMAAGGGGALDWHVRAARRAGASWEQLQAAVALAAAVNALGPANVGGAVLGRIAAEERVGTDGV